MNSVPSDIDYKRNVMTSPERPPGFFVAPFGIDGKSEGIAYWELDKLSAKWLAICDRHLELHGPVFNAPWSGNLSHIRMKFTSDSGVALATLSVHGRPAASVLLASGRSSEAETNVATMFVDSLRSAIPVKEAAASPEPFGKVFAINERPVMIVVPWTDSTISDLDHEVVRELALHTAGAFFGRLVRGS